MTSKVIGLSQMAILAPGRYNKSATHSNNMQVTLSKKDMQFGGAYKVPGTTAVAGVPDVMVSRLAVLYDQRSRRPVCSQISSAAGVYEFRNVAKGPWFVIAFDHTGEYNAVVADNILGTPM